MDSRVSITKRNKGFFKNKIIWMILLSVSVLPALVMAILISYQFYNGALDLVERHGEKRVNSLVQYFAQRSRDALLSGEFDKIPLLLSETINEPDVVEVRLISYKPGRVEFEQEKEVDVVTNWPFHTESNHNLTKTLYLLKGKIIPAKEVSLVSDNDILGQISVTYSRSAWISDIQNIVRHFYIYLFVILILVTIIAYTISKYGTRWLTDLANKIQKIAQGDLNQKFDSIGKGDIGVVEDGINSMTASLKSHRDDLQKKIDDATTELKTKNKELEASRKDQLEANKKLEKLNVSLLESRVELEDKNSKLESANMRLDEARAIADDASKAKSMFVTNISHDIRTPMNAIKGFSELLASSGELTEKQHDHLFYITQSADELECLIEDVINIAKIENGKYEPVLTSFDIFHEIELIISKQSFNLINKGLFVDFIHPVDAPVFVKSDIHAIRRIISNLFSNAIKFTEVGGIILSTEYIYHKNTSCTDFVFSIVDTGIGIEREDIDRIFSCFEQVDGSTTKGFKGTGLGLSIVEKFVKTLNGTVSLDSELNIGSTFKITIPIETKGLISKHRRAAIQMMSADKEGSKVIICDDRLSFCESIQSKLNYSGIPSEICSRKDLLEMHDVSSSIIALRDVLKMPELASSMGELGNKVISFETELSESNLHEVSQSKGVDIAVPSIMQSKKIAQYMSRLISSEDEAMNLSQDKEKLALASGMLASMKPALSGLKVLNVDDNPLNQTLNREIFEQLGAIVLDAENGVKAVDLASHEKFDIILMDMMMPIMDGATAAEKIKKEGLNKETAIIGLTAADISENNGVFVALMDKIFSKPFTKEEVLSGFFELQAMGKVSVFHEGLH